MCDYYSHCKGCPLDGSKCVIDSAVSDENCKRFAATVEQWSKEHPRKTRQSVFLEQYPEARIGDDGVLQVDPCSIPRRTGTHGITMRREFWSAEVEE